MINASKLKEHNQKNFFTILRILKIWGSFWSKISISLYENPGIFRFSRDYCRGSLDPEAVANFFGLFLFRRATHCVCIAHFRGVWCFSDYKNTLPFWSKLKSKILDLIHILYVQLERIHFRSNISQKLFIFREKNRRKKNEPSLKSSNLQS